MPAFSYRSVRDDLSANAASLSRFLAARAGARIDLVAHSLGGLVVLRMLALHPDPRVRRVVLLGSPCAGSHCASVLFGLPLMPAIVGRSMREALAIPSWPLPTGVEIGVIAGRRSVGLGRIIPGLPLPNDGTVAVAETALAGARDRLVLPVSHSEMLFFACLRGAGGRFPGSRMFCSWLNGFF